MGILENMDYKDIKMYDDKAISGEYKQILYLQKTVGNANKPPIYYIRAYTIINGQLIEQGYIYFYLDYINKKSSFIGIKVEEQFRNLNIASFLLATWIDLCLNNGYTFLDANQKQRKPFLLYLLKKYGFEVFDKSLYETRNDVISICQDLKCQQEKKLFFRDERHEKQFIGLNVFKTDNYHIVHDLNSVILLDNVILPLQGAKRANINYSLLDEALAEEKVVQTINNHHL